jgi:hypothetical protein
LETLKEIGTFGYLGIDEILKETWYPEHKWLHLQLPSAQ